MLSRSTAAWRVAVGVRLCHVNKIRERVAFQGAHAEMMLPVRNLGTDAWKPKTGSDDTERRSKRPPMVCRQLTIEAKLPDLTVSFSHGLPSFNRFALICGQTKSEILTCSKKLRMSGGQWVRFCERGRQAVVILGTPSFASWLEDDEVFIPKLLESITRPSLKASTPTVIEVICACVDGLSPHFDSFHNLRGKHPVEGFSLLHGTRNDILPKLWSASDVPATESSVLNSTITFSRSKRNTTVTLPLANTLFKTGKQSTLLVAKWEARNGSYVKTASEQRRDVAVNVFGRLEPGIPRSIIPAVPLTPARRIISGLGNIVRQLDFGDDGIGPASRELEKNVYEYLELKGRSNSTISVWALIVPENTQAGRTSRRMERLLVDEISVKRLWTKSHPRTDYVGHMIGKGATFYRVGKFTCVGVLYWHVPFSTCIAY